MSSSPDSPAVAAAPPDNPERPDIAVSVALSQAGYLFSIFKNDRIGVFWEIPFALKDGGNTTIELQSHEPHLVLIGDPQVGKPDDKLCRDLLMKNGQVVTGRIGFNSQGEVIVVAHFQREVLSASRLRHDMQDVLETIMAVRHLAGIGPSGSVQAPSQT